MGPSGADPEFAVRARFTLCFILAAATGASAQDDRPATNSFLESGLFGDVGGAILWPSTQGLRSSIPGFQPIVPSRFPGLNASGLNGFSGPFDSGDNFLGNFNLMVGYRFPEQVGELFVRYRPTGGERLRIFANGDPIGAAFLQQRFRDDSNSDENSQARLTEIERGHPDPFGAVAIRTVLAAHALDLAYGQSLSLSQLELRGAVGGRFGSVRFDDRSEGIGLVSESRTSFAGAGPMASLGVEWLPWKTTGLLDYQSGFYARADGGLLFGRTRQRESEFFARPGRYSVREAEVIRNNAVPVYSIEAGLTVRGAPTRRGSVQIGYQFEQWLDVGRVGRSRFDLTLQGLFFRLAYNY